MVKAQGDQGLTGSVISRWGIVGMNPTNDFTERTYAEMRNLLPLHKRCFEDSVWCVIKGAAVQNKLQRVDNCVSVGGMLIEQPPAEKSRSFFPRHCWQRTRKSK